MFHLRHLQYLNAVYQYRNFTRASEALYVSQPAISSGISALEAELGVKLVVRNSKKVVFTYEGEQLIAWSQRILRLCAETENAMQDLASSAGQRLRLGLSHAFVDLVPGIFSTFMEQHPGARICLDEGSTDRHVELVRSGQLDMAYNGLPEGPGADEFQQIPMGTAEIHAVLHPDSPLAALDRLPLPLLAGEKLIMMDLQSRVCQVLTQALERHQIVPDIVLNYSQILCMVNLVRSCRHVGIISAVAGQRVPGCEGLVLRPFREPLTFEVGIFLKKDRYLPKLGWELIRFLRQARPLPAETAGPVPCAARP